MQVTKGKQLVVTLRKNSISRVTNRMEWRYSCSNSEFGLFLNLDDNILTNVTDMIQSWYLIDNVNNTECLKGVKNGSSISLANNPIICTCQDYEFITRNYWLYKQVWCSTIYPITDAQIDIQQDLVGHISRNALKCKVDECPSTCACFNQPSKNSLIVD